MKLSPGQARALASWMRMVQRCCDAANPQFDEIGGRGIGFADEWLDPWSFLRDMGERPEGMNLGRKDIDAAFSPANCVWQSDLAKNRNTRRNVFIGEATQSQVAEVVGMSEATIMRRRQAGVAVTSARRFRGNKLSREQAAAIKARLLQPGSNSTIAREFAVSHTLIGMFRRGEVWAFVDPAEAACKDAD